MFTHSDPLAKEPANGHLKVGLWPLKYNLLERVTGLT